MAMCALVRVNDTTETKALYTNLQKLKQTNGWKITWHINNTTRHFCDRFHAGSPSHLVTEPLCLKRTYHLHVRDLNSYKYIEKRKMHILYHVRLSYHLSHNKTHNILKSYVTKLFTIHRWKNKIYNVYILCFVLCLLFVEYMAALSFFITITNHIIQQLSSLRYTSNRVFATGSKTICMLCKNSLIWWHPPLAAAYVACHYRQFSKDSDYKRWWEIHLKTSQACNTCLEKLVTQSWLEQEVVVTTQTLLSKIIWKLNSIVSKSSYLTTQYAKRNLEDNQ